MPFIKPFTEVRIVTAGVLVGVVTVPEKPFAVATDILVTVPPETLNGPNVVEPIVTNKPAEVHHISPFRGNAGAAAQFRLKPEDPADDATEVTLPVNVPPLIGIPGVGLGPGDGCAEAQDADKSNPNTKKIIFTMISPKTCGHWKQR